MIKMTDISLENGRIRVNQKKQIESQLVNYLFGITKVQLDLAQTFGFWFVDNFQEKCLFGWMRGNYKSEKIDYVLDKQNLNKWILNHIIGQVGD